jgi:hypothetical protein
MAAAPPIVLDGASYVERWSALDDDVRLGLAGSKEAVVQLDALARRKLTPEAAAEQLGESKRRARQVAGRLRGAEQRVLKLRAERKVLSIEQAILGEEQQVIAENVGRSPMIIAIAIGTSTKQRASRES